VDKVKVETHTKPDENMNHGNRCRLLSPKSEKESVLGGNLKGSDQEGSASNNSEGVLCLSTKSKSESRPKTDSKKRDISSPVLIVVGSAESGASVSAMSPCLPSSSSSARRSDTNLGDSVCGVVSHTADSTSNITEEGDADDSKLSPRDKAIPTTMSGSRSTPADNKESLPSGSEVCVEVQCSPEKEHCKVVRAPTYTPEVITVDDKAGGEVSPKKKGVSSSGSKTKTE